MREEFYDDKTEPIIELKQFYGEQKHLVDKCLIIFSKSHTISCIVSLIFSLIMLPP